MWWKDFVTWVMSVYPQSNPIVVAVYAILAFIFVWLFKEFKNQYAQEVQKNHERVDKTIELYAQLLSALPPAKQEDTNQNVHKAILQLFPYLDKDMYHSFKQYLRTENVDVQQMRDQVYERIDQLKSKYNDINHHDFTFTGTAESVGMFLRKCFVPFGYTIMVFAGGLFIFVLYGLSPDHPLRFLARLSSFYLLFMILLFLGDVWLKENFIHDIRRNGVFYLFIVIAPIIILFIPHWITVVLGIILFTFGVYIKKGSLKHQKEEVELF